MSTAATTFIILTMLYVLAWPTFASAMTSYTPSTQPLVYARDGSYIPMGDFQPVVYTIHDGWRIGLTGDFPVLYMGSTTATDQWEAREFSNSLLTPLS